MQDFVKITNINDVLPFITEFKEFSVVEEGDYTVIDYDYQTSESFPAELPILRELRGIIFDKQGNIIRRPLHKFFNLNEREECSFDVMNEQALLVQEKLDGLLIAPFKIPNVGIRWGTRRGITDVGMAAEEFVSRNPQYMSFAETCIESDITPIFEWLNPNRPIVLTYPEQSLRLLAVRDMTTGVYYDIDDLQLDNIPVVTMHAAMELSDFTYAQKHLTDAEGWVMTTDEGYKFKVKGDWYVGAHKAVDIMSKPQKLLQKILSGDIHDFKATLDSVGDYLKMIQRKEEEFWEFVGLETEVVCEKLAGASKSGLSKKELYLQLSESPSWSDRVTLRVYSLGFDHSPKSYISTQLYQHIKIVTESKHKFEQILKDKLWKDPVA